MATPKAPPRKAGDRALDQALAPLEYGEGFRLLLIGDTGCGKTVAAKAVAAGYLKRSPGVVGIIDDKRPDRSRFVGQYRRDVAELARQPLDPELGRTVIFRGEPAKGVFVDHQEVDAWQWSLVKLRRPSLVIHDEITDALTYGQWRAGKHSTIGRSYHKGRDLEISKVAGARLIQEIPLEVFEQSDMVWAWRMDGAGVAKLVERRFASSADNVGDVIPQLPGIDVPPDKRGDFIALVRGRPWDGYVYRFEEE